MSITSSEQSFPELAETELQALVDVFELLLKWDQALPSLVDTQEVDEG